MARTVLPGAFEKVRLANQHIAALDREIGTSINDDSYELITETEMDCFDWVEVPITEAQSLGVRFVNPNYPASPGNIVTYLMHASVMGAYLRIREPLPFLKWGAIIGDVLNNLRSALDQLVWELSLRHQRSLGQPLAPFPPTDTLPRPSLWRSIQFPVADTDARWKEQSRTRLRLINQNLLPRFDNEQPYKGGNRYQRHWLWLLDELWNRDKHRSVTITATYGMLTAVTFYPAPGETFTVEDYAREFEARALWVQPHGRYQNNVKLANVLVARKNPRLPELHVQFAVKADLSLNVLFKKSAPTYGGPVLDTLKRLSTEVERVLNLFIPDLK